MAWGLETWTTLQTVTVADMTQGINANLEAGFPDEVTSVDFSPTLEATTTDPTTSHQSGQRYQTGAMMDYYGRFVLSSGFSGRLFVTLPDTVVGLSAQATEGSGQAIGSWSAYDTSTGFVAAGTVNLRAADEIQFSLGGTTNAASLADTVPWTWASGDVLTWWVRVPIA